MIMSWTWGPRTYGLLFHVVGRLSFFTAFCFSILDTSRFNITVPRRINMTSPPFTNFTPPCDSPTPIFFAKYPVFRNYRIMWQQYLTLTAALAARILHSPIIRSLVFIFIPLFCKIKVKINFFLPLTLSLDNWKNFYS